MIRNRKLHSLHLYTSYYSGIQWPNQLHHPAQIVPPNAPEVKKVLDQAFLHSPPYKIYFPPRDDVPYQNPDCSHGTTPTPLQNEGCGRISPISDAKFLNGSILSSLELYSDYLCECGGQSLALKSVTILGAILTAYRTHYGDVDIQIARILIKLTKGLRRAGYPRAARRAGWESLRVLSSPKLQSVDLETMLEALLEQAQNYHHPSQTVEPNDEGTQSKDRLSLAQNGLKEITPDMFVSSSISLFAQYSDIGNVERYTRLIPRTIKMNQQLFEKRWIHYSPFDYDRCYALMDTLLELAESFHRAKGDLEKVREILLIRVQINEKKSFSRRIYAGKITTQRGRGQNRSKKLTTTPTSEELLRYAPTIHQVHFEYKYLLTAPLGQEDEVWPGVDRITEDGDPLRRRRHCYRNNMARVHGHKVEFQQAEYN